MKGYRLHGEPRKKTKKLMFNTHKTMAGNVDDSLDKEFGQSAKTKYRPYMSDAYQKEKRK